MLLEGLTRVAVVRGGELRMVSARSAAGVERSLLDGVLAVVRELGGCAGLAETLRVIADAIVDVLGFGAAAVNVSTPEGDLRVDAVAGPPGVRELLGTCRPLRSWLDLLAAAEPWGELRFFSHERDQTDFNRFPTWSPSGPVGAEPDAWHPEDSLLAPLWDEQRNLVGVLSVDEPRTGRHPDLEQRTVLEVFASQAGKAIRDAQVREAADAARSEVESRWQLAFEHSPNGTALMTVDGRIVQANDALASMLGYSSEQLAGMRFADITHPEDLEANLALFTELVDGSRDSYDVEKRYLRRDSSIVHAQLRVASIRDPGGRLQTIVSQISDITERKQAEQRLANQRRHDQLTGLLNHTGIADQLAHRLSRGQPTAVLFCDIDRFKTINNSLGRAAGDQILAAVATRLAQSVPEQCALARVGDDEFVLLAPPGSDRAAVQDLGERIIDTLRRPLIADRLRHTVSLSIGAAISDPGYGHADELMADAEQAMRRAKRRGRARIEFYDPEQDHTGTLEDLQLEQALRTAIEVGNQFRVHLQPIVNIADEAVIGAEALIRWEHPQRGLLPPSAFLPTAEHSGLIVELGWSMLTLGTQAAAALHHDYSTDAWVSVNVSGNQLGRGKLPSAVRTALATSGLAAQSLHLEFTETALVEATPQAIREVHEVADMGINIALDDFGTGYSSLSLLRDLPISVVKIDRSFTTHIAENRRTAALVRSLVTMCNALDIKTIAEGIETREQLALVSSLGCDHAQGYLFGKPKPPPLPGAPLINISRSSARG